MRILKLRLANLNSLAGEWSIDFTHPAYEEAGLFAITGPTGVGKTTVLDAICLALYGQTPRLGRLSKNANEIMTRRRAECLAELVFESSAGRFRCQWSQHRSRKKASGELQAPRHELVDDISGRVLESSTLKTQAAIESRVGMDFSQFTRAMLLSQGAFAAFLQAEPSQRAALLEKITAADVYGAISMRTHERRRMELEKIRALEQELKAVQEDWENPAELKSQREALAERLKNLQRTIDENAEAARWRERLDSLERKAAEAAERWGRLELRLNEFKPLAEKIRRGRLARPAQAFYSQYQRSEAQWRDLDSKLASEAAREAGLKAELARRQSQAERAAAEYTGLKARLEAARPLWRSLGETERRFGEARRLLRGELEAWAAQRRQTLSWRARQSAEGALEPREIQKRLEAQKELMASLKAEFKLMSLKRDQALAAAALAERRAQLQEGQPCPLCGALEHPYCADAPAASMEIEASWRRLQRELELAQRRESALAAQRAAIDSEAQSAAERLQREEELLAAARQRLRAVAGESRRRRREYGQVRAEAGALPSEETLSAAARRAEGRAAAAERDFQSVWGESLAFAARLEELRRQKSELQRRRELDAQSFQEALAQAGLAGEAEYLAAALPHQELERLEDEERKLAEERGALLELQRELSQRLAEERGLALSSEPLAELKRRAEAGRSELAEAQRRMGALEQALRRAEANDLKRRELAAALAAARKEGLVWDSLHELIGSHDGKKFRDYAQSLAFAALVAQANKQLSGLSDRYRLAADPRQALELLVIDEYQGGEIRSTKNLSGGESFLVSLALALGLSKLSSRRARVDSLFLDEGFGSLDEDALEAALDTLAGLKKDGKLIGVISHVPAVTERLGVRIRVFSRGGAFSALKGPGVSCEASDERPLLPGGPESDKF